MGCINDKLNHRQSCYTLPLQSKSYLMQCSELIEEYSRIEKELSKQRVHLNNLILSQKKQDLALNIFCLSQNNLMMDNKNDWIDQTYYNEMQYLSQLEKKVINEPKHHLILIKKINRVRQNFTRLVKSLNSTKAAHKKLISMGQKYGVQDHQDLEVVQQELKIYEQKFLSYFDRSQTRNKTSLSQATQSTNSNF